VAAGQPEQVIDEFVKLFNSQDLDGILENCYEDDAVLVPEPGAGSVSGRAAIREVLQAFLGMGGTMTVVGAAAYTHGDIGLTHSRWHLDVPGGEAMEGTTAEIVRRQADGTWRYIVDNPWGGAVLDAAS
jgi:ketosteroid isomerase-like protein